MVSSIFMFYKVTSVIKYHFHLHVTQNRNNYFTSYGLLMAINKWDIEI
jgi:hypothetical protein